MWLAGVCTYPDEIDGGVVGVRDAVGVRDPGTGAFRNIPRQLQHVAWRRVNMRKQTKYQSHCFWEGACGLKTPAAAAAAAAVRFLFIFSDITLTRLDVNVCAAGLHPVCADGVRPAGFVLERDHDLLSDLGFDYWTYRGQEETPLPSSVFSW